VDKVHECDRRTDRQTDGQTDRIMIPKTVQRRASHGKNYNDFREESGALSFICIFVACLMSVPIIYSNYKNINLVFMGFKASKTIKYFIINGTTNKMDFSRGGFFGGFY